MAGEEKTGISAAGATGIESSPINTGIDQSELAISRYTQRMETHFIILEDHFGQYIL